MTPERLERLELKLAYLEQANQELSDVVYRQQQELEDMRERLAVLTTRIEVLKAGETQYTPEQERPPHY
jgi:uncharacterized coiled-coil protein SlyX